MAWTSSDMMKRMERWLYQHPREALAIPLGIALVVRLIGVVARPIWYDEAFAVLFAEKGPGAMLVGTLAPTSAGASDVHPLAYYTLLWAWMGLFGESPSTARALSILASLGTIAVAYLLTLRLFDRHAAFAAGVLLALAPFQVHYSQEIRMYAFLAFWLALATYCYWQGSQSTRWSWWAAFAVFAALGQYTHNLASFYLLAVALWPLLTRDWRVLLRVAVAGVASLVIYLPWLVHLPAQLAKVGQAYWIEKPGLYRLLTLLLAYLTNLPVEPKQLAVCLTAALSVTTLALVQTTRAIRHKTPNWQRAIWILYLAFAPPVLVFIFSQWKPLYLERAFLPSGVAFCIWIAWALTHTNTAQATRFLLVLMVITAFSVGLFEHLTYSGFPYAPYQRIVDSLRSHAQAGDVILHSSKLSFLPTVYYDRNLRQEYLADPPGSSVDTLAPSTQQVLGLEASDDLSKSTAHSSRVWFLIFRESDQEYIQAGYPRHPHLTWLMMHYHLIETQHWDDLDMYLFSLES